MVDGVPVARGASAHLVYSTARVGHGERDLPKIFGVIVIDAAPSPMEGLDQVL
jgi:hypothetical protein